MSNWHMDKFEGERYIPYEKGETNDVVMLDYYSIGTQY